MCGGIHGRVKGKHAPELLYITQKSLAPFSSAHVHPLDFLCTPFSSYTYNIYIYIHTHIYIYIHIIYDGVEFPFKQFFLICVCIHVCTCIICVTWEIYLFTLMFLLWDYLETKFELTILARIWFKLLTEVSSFMGVIESFLPLFLTWNITLFELDQCIIIRTKLEWDVKLNSIWIQRQVGYFTYMQMRRVGSWKLVIRQSKAWRARAGSWTSWAELRASKARARHFVESRRAESERRSHELNL